MPPKRTYIREIKELNDRTRALLAEKYKDKRKRVRLPNGQRLVVNFTEPELENLRVQYNNELKEERIKRRKELQKQKYQEKRDKPVTFIIHAELEIRYKQSWYDMEDGVRYPKDSKSRKNITTQPFTSKRSKMLQYVEDLNYSDEYKEVMVLQYVIQEMNEDKQKRTYRPPQQQMMKDAFVLRNDWLKYGHGISEHAYKNLDGECVYDQLCEFLLQPPTGNPTKFISSMRTSKETLFTFFSIWCDGNENYPGFHIKSGVSSEMIKELCETIKRNMYAYDEDNKVFLSVTKFPSKHYCPLIFYKLHGHFYLIDDPFTIRSVAESNKHNAIPMITMTVNEEVKREDLPVTILDNFEVEKAMELTAGIYLVKKSSLNADVIRFYELYQMEPKIKTSGGNICEIRYLEHGRRRNREQEVRQVIICVDATHGEKYSYQQLKNVADTNHIKYVNEGIGSLLVSIIKKSKQTKRVYLTDKEKVTFFRKYENKCAVCEIVCKELEIDHITPLACGGSNELDNLQPLCPDCHKLKTTEEKTLGIYKADEEISFFNDLVLKNVVNTFEFKTWSFVETVKPYTVINPKSKEFKLDCRKSRRNNLFYNQKEFPRFSVMDNVKPFSGVVQCGLYFVKTDNIFPFRGNGWYLQALVEYGLSQNLISPNNIIAELLPSHKLPANYFQKQVDVLLKAFECEPEIQKLAVNSLVGTFGRTKATATDIKFTLDPYNASQWWVEKEDNRVVFIRDHNLENGRKLYEGIFAQEMELEGTKYLLYKQVLENEIIELHKLETALRDRGAVILDRNTDAIRYLSLNEIEIQAYWDKDIPKYQREEPKELRCQMMAHLKREKDLDLGIFDLQWNIQYDYPSTVEKAALEIVEKGESMHIDGRAGCGKTTLLNAVKKVLKERNMTWKAFAPTNKAARLIGGETIHSVFQKYKSKKNILFKALQKVDYIFIDEVSMMVKDFYQLFTLIKRSFPEMRFIISGDFGQLPPVNDNWTGDYENSAALYLLCGGNRIVLTKCRRADDRLFQLCKQVDELDFTQYQYKEFQATEKTWLNLALTHTTRKRVNKECMQRYLQEMKPSQTVFIGRNKFNAKTQDVTLAKGMPVIAHKTVCMEEDIRVLNSQRFIVKSVNSKTIVLIEECGDGVIKIPVTSFHKYFYLGYCLTIHASQGETFTSKYTVYDWGHPNFCSKAKYVALSRGTAIENIQIVM